MNWISVKDRLPEFEEEVILFDDWTDRDNKRHRDMRIGYLGSVTVTRFQNGVSNSCEWRGTEFAFNITHWHPLPEPPNEHKP